MSGNTNPNQQRGAELVEAFFTSLSAEAEAVIEALVGSATRIVTVIDMNDNNPQDLISTADFTARPNEGFVVTGLVIIAQGDISAETDGSTFTLDTLNGSQTILWDDFNSTLTFSGALVSIVLDGIDGALATDTLLFTQDPIISTSDITTVLVGYWIPFT